MTNQHLAALVCHEALTKRDALSQLQGVFGFEIRNEYSANPVVILDETTWLTIDIPKFGEAPPLTLDVWSNVSVDDARAHALSLASQIAENLDWTVIADFEAR